jgi:hypothetical protein
MKPTKTMFNDPDLDQAVLLLSQKNPNLVLRFRRARRNNKTGKVTIFPDHPLFHIPENYIEYCQMLHRLWLVHYPVVNVPKVNPRRITVKKLIKANPASEFMPRLIAILN